MSVKSALKARIISKFLAHRTSAGRREKRRSKFEKKRIRAGRQHELDYFHQPGDPYSYFAAKALKPLLERYDLKLRIHIVGAPDASMVPEPEKLQEYGFLDATRLADKYGLSFPPNAKIPEDPEIEKATSILVAAVEDGTILDVIEEVSFALWGMEISADLPVAGPDETQRHLLHSAALRKKLGHYQGGVFCYGGECYSGLDRLHYLEERLISLNVSNNPKNLLFPPISAVRSSVTPLKTDPIEFFVSLRSPYSAISARRVIDIGRKYDVPIHIRYVLPMVMRGLPVPREKALYIVEDAAREANRLDIPFGHICDPLGRPTERGLALMPLAKEKGVMEAYLLSFLEGVWAEGLDAGSDKGLRMIAERAGLNWEESLLALEDETWRDVAEENQSELDRLGLWGVPSFNCRNISIWGQDRLWALEEAL